MCSDQLRNSTSFIISPFTAGDSAYFYFPPFE
jgi:hypothetical protein